LASAMKFHHIYDTLSKSHLLCESHGVCHSPLSWWYRKCAVVTGYHGLSRKIWCAMHDRLWRHNPVCMRWCSAWLPGTKFMVRTLVMVVTLSKRIRTPIWVRVQVYRKLRHINMARMGFEIML